MKVVTNQKGISLVILLILLAIAVAGIVVYFLVFQNITKPSSSTNLQPAVNLKSGYQNPFKQYTTSEENYQNPFRALK